MGTIYCGCDPSHRSGPYYCEFHRQLHRELLEDGRGQLETIVENGPTRATTLPTDGAERKRFPVATGVLDYFPDAIVAVANVSWQGNEQHNPGEPLHWARGKSMDQDDTLMRHFLERGKRDTDGQRHSAKMAWRALAILQLEIEAEKESK